MLGPVPFSSTSSNSSYISNAHGTLVVPSSKMNFTLIFNYTTNSVHGVSPRAFSIVTELNSPFFYIIIGAFTTLLAIAIVVFLGRKENE